jgi:hypothetical protein
LLSVTSIARPNQESEAAELARKATETRSDLLHGENGKTGLTVLLDTGDGAVLATLTADRDLAR